MIDITPRQLAIYTTGCAGVGVIAALATVWVEMVLLGNTLEKSIVISTIAAVPAIPTFYLIMRWEIKRMADQADSNVSDTREAEPERETA